MEKKLEEILDRAIAERKENKKFLEKLGKKPPANLDALFFEGQEDYFNKNSCLDCGNCCKTTSPIFRDVDIERIAKYLKIKPGDFTSRYLHLDEDNDWVLNRAPCVFLGSDNYCSIYDVRPLACREYPHMERKHINKITGLTFNNTLVCPAVATVVSRLKKVLT